MKKLILALPLLAAIISPTHAQANEGVYKTNTIKRMYRDAAITMKKYDNADELNTIYAYSNRELQNAVAITKADAINFLEENGGMVSYCNEVRAILSLSEGDESILESNGLDFVLLKNGRVRTNMYTKHYKNLNSPDYLFFKDFSLKCEGASCKVTDIYNHTGESGMSAANKYCR
ncbi:hypothetical protein [Psychrobacter urativorans]|uniref:Uncharacterized protein n=1 Tax=Psychrobacter urativorans TaxID=45610 RepID=A0A0M4TVT8_9GAMM|nr:hypothetical protein [Psychrobacter urativorans]ALF60111.1 hypothetical protein AOC03_08735 [Psychrobacter urativorans]